MAARDTQEDTMTTTSVGTTATRSRRTGKGLLSTCAFVVAFGVGVIPAAAAPEEGVPPATTDCSHVVWGWPNGADGPAYPGQRFGVFLAPQCRGPVLEGLDP
jgi:hypothetical protein